MSSSKRDREFIIRAENLRKEYKRGRETVDAIKNITLKIDEREFFVFIGHIKGREE